MYRLGKLIVAFALLAILALAFGTAVQADDGVWKNGIKKPQKDWYVGASLPEFKHPFFGAQLQAITDAGRKYGFKVEVRDAEQDPAKQIGIIEEFIVKKVDCILLCPAVSNALVSAVKKANAAGIPVIILNRTLGDGADYITYVGADDYTGGRVQGKMLATALKGKGNIILLQGVLGSSPQVQREAGLEDEIAAYPDLKIAAKFPCDFDRGKALAATQDALVRFPKGSIDAIVTQDSEMCMTALQAVKAAGRTELVGRIVAFDYPSYVKESILKGDFLGTVLQDPYQQAMIGMDVVWMYLSGHKGHIPQPLFFTPLPGVIKSNAAIFPPSW